ncbi:MAG: cell division topological specificity factor MinE [Alphaproteobacteria bacterium]
MSLFRLLDFFRARRPPPAAVAKERLQILLAHERADRGARADFLPSLQKDLLEVISRYLVIDQDKVTVKLERGKDLSVLEVDIELPGPNVPLARPRAFDKGEKKGKDKPAAPLATNAA